MGVISESPTPEMQVVTVKEAAKLLGITEGGVRKRLTKGTLKGEKDDKGFWIQVMLPADLEPPAEDHASELENPEVVMLLREIIDRQDRDIASRDRRIDFLESQLQQRDALYAESLRQIRALMPPEETEIAGKRRSWWAWWRKK